MTKRTTQTWSAAQPYAIQASRSAWIAAATAAGKTDGVPSKLGTYQITRDWADAAAAAEWTAFITDLATQHGLTVTVTTADI